MIHWRVGTVTAAVRAWPGAAEYDVEVPADDTTVRALAYTEVVGTPVVGDRVLLNVSALRRGLGTGGFALVVAIPDRLPIDPPPGDGHIVKARYTPLQQMVLSVDEQDSPDHATLAAADSLDGLPVVSADLHSALPAILAGIRADRPDLKVAYVMTDDAALPLAFSRAVAGLVEARWLHTTVTVGQAFGGAHEAVTLHSGLLACRHVLGADIAIVAQGPGNAGTGTPWGFSGVSAGEALNAVTTLGGRGVACLRVSEADERPRHHGLSHHSVTAFGRVLLGRADVPIPRLEGEFGERVARQAHELCAGASGTLTPHEIDISRLGAALEASPVRLSTMGRGLNRDGSAFVSAAAAGRHAASLVGGAR
ncbi:DUF3866 family protein [Janibacter sp. G1551]|uniref:DUF3866 family protein n=1 Tax=Janibacter sp. G1551 TaxID=3420440 RepID=UPI003D0626B3